MNYKGFLGSELNYKELKKNKNINLFNFNQIAFNEMDNYYSMNKKRERLFIITSDILETKKQLAPSQRNNWENSGKSFLADIDYLRDRIIKKKI